MGMKRKFVPSGPEEQRSPRKNEVSTKDVPASYWLQPTRPKKSATLNSPKASDAACIPIPTPLPQAVEDSPTSLPISRPLEPTPAIHTLPVDESFCPSGFNMLEILVL